MSTRHQHLVAVSVLLAITISTSAPAHAGILDWFRSEATKAAAPQDQTFDQLYASMLMASQQDEDALTFSGNAILPAKSPSGGVAKTLRKTYMIQLSGYNSEVAQTDDSPFITAKGTYVRDGIVATNMFPFGTAIKIPALYGDKIFVVEDRMNRRYQNNVDIWFADKSEAIQLGRRTVQIEVIQ